MKRISKQINTINMFLNFILMKSFEDQLKHIYNMLVIFSINSYLIKLFL